MGNHTLLRVPANMSGKPWETKVKEYIRDGWNFRVKTSKGKRYITRRRGQDEKGMGRFIDEHWSAIERIRDEYLEVSNRAQEDVAAKIDSPIESEASESEVSPPGLSRREYLMKKIIDHIDLYRGALKMVECRYNVNKHCVYWTWIRRPSFFDDVDECFGPNMYARMDIRVDDKDENMWVFRASPWYCGHCSSFTKIVCSEP